MTQIMIDDEWMIVIDTLGNHMPHRYKEKQKNVKGEGWVGTGEWDWVSENKFFPNVPQCIRYIFEQGVLDEDKMTLLEYVERIEKMEYHLK